MDEWEIGTQLHLASSESRCILFIWMGPKTGMVRIWSRVKNTWGHTEQWRHYDVDYPTLHLDQMHQPRGNCVVDTGDWNG